MASDTQETTSHETPGFMTELRALSPWWSHLALSVLGAIFTLWFIGPIGSAAPAGLLAGLGAVAGLLFLPTALGLVHLLAQPVRN
jgi:hypothetical protein